MSKTTIAPYKQLNLKIYGYHLPQLPTHAGSVKVGETDYQDVNIRIRQQTSTVGVNPDLLFARNAVRSDGKLFHDRDLHAYYRLRGIKRSMLNDRSREWYYFGDVSLAETITDDYISLDYDEVQRDDGESDYTLRAEQAQAVQSTLDYFQNPTHKREFLWNAKPRFGKTLTTYDLVRKLGAKNVLIVTNRPAIANSWYDDFVKFIAWQEPGMIFVSETDALNERQPISRQEFQDYAIANIDRSVDIRSVNFISLQDLKGARFAGGQFEKLEWVGELYWDLLVIDEAHEGIDTLKTDRAFSEIKRNYTLHLSGTPFKAIASEKFHADQIFNWSYLDEQAAKATWEDNEIDSNPYANLPTLNLFTYQMSKIIEVELAKGINLDDETNLDYAFDLNEFFNTTDKGKFVYEAEVIRFLDNLHTGKFPFAEREHQQELNHTFWLLPRVAAAKAMEQLLNNHPFFKDYNVVLAAGDGNSLLDDEDSEDFEERATNPKRNKRSFDRVRQAIASKPRTITLSVGQLTTGVTIPEWSAVLMLSNIKSPALYFQASFRAQNPWEFQNPQTGEWFRKENAYVFDFAPDRTLVLYDDFANNLSDRGVRATEKERQENIRQMINFFPVIAEDDQGSLREISPEEVLTIPSHIKAVEVVKRGFMSNLLFANIGAIFSAPAELKAILDKISPEANKRLANKRDVKVTDPMLNEKGDVEVSHEVIINTSNGLFGEAIYKTDYEAVVEKFEEITNRESAAKKMSKELVRNLDQGITRTAEEMGWTKKTTELNSKAAEKMLTQKIEENLYQRDQRMQQATASFEKELVKNLEQQASPKMIQELTEHYEARRTEIEADLLTDIQNSVKETTQSMVGKELERKEEAKKKSTEDDVRDHLRGFSRTIPAFLMAYGSPETTLATYDENIDPDTFVELTSITLDEFRKLRDGFYYLDENGQQKSIPGLFNESVFNTSVKEFFKIKDNLADYLHGGNEEDIFDYIPPQRTNQIFTPRKVVVMMVDLLEEHDPQIFKNKETTFIDLYAKSGLYLTEIAKRLFAGLREAIPDEAERVRWILEHQLYGCAPSNIIYNMVRNYVYAGFPGVDQSNLLELDLTEAAKAGRVKEELAERFGKEMKFDVIIGNPPYQEETFGTSDNPIYHLFMQEAYNLADRVCLITPARFLFDAGKTPKAWNQQMLNDPHLNVAYYEPDSTNVFPGVVSLMGGVSITYRDLNTYFGPIKKFIPNNILKSITKKVNSKGENSLSELVYSPESYRISKILHQEYPQAKDFLSSGHLYDLTTNIFDKLNFLFIDQQPHDEFQYIKIYGRQGNKRVYRWIRRDYVENHENLMGYKVVLPKSNGSPTIGAADQTPVIGEPVICEPNVGHNQSFVSIGNFSFSEEATAALKYIKSKFARAMLGTLKVTQDNKRATWRNVPIQDFTADSDIDWTKSIAEIDQQLYKKYGLDEEEIAFIESMIRPME